MMSTQTLDDAARLLADQLLVDSVRICNVGEPVTVGTNVTRSLDKSRQPIQGLVQTTTLANAAESAVTNTYSIKVPRGTELVKGQAVEVVSCRAEPSLVGRVLLVDKVSENGIALIRKGVATDFYNVNQQGKAGLS